MGCDVEELGGFMVAEVEEEEEETDRGEEDTDEEFTLPFVDGITPVLELVTVVEETEEDEEAEVEFEIEEDEELLDT